MLKNRLLLVGILVVAVVAVAVLLLLQSQGGAAPAAEAVHSISPSDYQTQFMNTSAPHLLIDVRTPEEFASGHIARSINISVETLENRLSEIPHDQPVIVYCRSGNRSTQAAQILASAGYTDIRNLGGINAWTEQGFPIE
jgi:rhodanese-related sulfurtransferase